MQAIDSRCDLCKNWKYHYPDDMGVCANENGPAEDVNGFVVPVMSGAVLSEELRTKYPTNKATTCDTRCGNWQSDGTAKASEVAALRAKEKTLGTG